MAICIDVLPKIDPIAFADSVKIGIVIGLLTTAADLLPYGPTRGLILRAIIDLGQTVEADE